MFHRWKSNGVWNDMRVNERWQNFYFLVKYHFKCSIVYGFLLHINIHEIWWSLSQKNVRNQIKLKVLLIFFFLSLPLSVLILVCWRKKNPRILISLTNCVLLLCLCQFWQAVSISCSPNILCHGLVVGSALNPGSGQDNAGAYGWILWDLSLREGRTGPSDHWLGSREFERGGRQPASQHWPKASFLTPGYKLDKLASFSTVLFLKSHVLVPAMSANY